MENAYRQFYIASQKEKIISDTPRGSSILCCSCKVLQCSTLPRKRGNCDTLQLHHTITHLPHTRTHTHVRIRTHKHLAEGSNERHAYRHTYIHTHIHTHTYTHTLQKGAILSDTPTGTHIYTHTYTHTPRTKQQSRVTLRESLEALIS